MLSRCYALAPLVVLSISLTSFADEVRGIISKVDSSGKQIVLEGRGRGARGVALTLDLQKDTQIRFGSEAGEPSDLQPGEHVRVFYEVRDGKRVALAVTVRGAKKKTAPVPSGDNAVTGTLARVAVSDREIVVIGPGAKEGTDTETTFSVPEKAQITRDGKPIKFEDLKEGEQVAVKAEEQGGKKEAQSIQVGAAKPPAVTAQQRIERLRAALKVADWLLGRVADRNNNTNP
jgi:3-dehydroquinate synthase class II